MLRLERQQPAPGTELLPSRLAPRGEQAQNTYLRRRPEQRSARLMQIAAHLRFIFRGAHHRVLSRHLGIRRGTVAGWFNGRGRIPTRRLMDLERLITDIAQVVATMRADIRAELEQRAKEPPPRRGFHVVKDWGDGFLPHDSRPQTLRRLGLLPARASLASDAGGSGVEERGLLSGPSAGSGEGGKRGSGF